MPSRLNCRTRRAFFIHAGRLTTHRLYSVWDLCQSSTYTQQLLICGDRQYKHNKVSAPLYYAARICLFFSHLCPHISSLLYVCAISATIFILLWKTNKAILIHLDEILVLFRQYTATTKNQNNVYVIKVGNSQNISRFSLVFKSLPIIFIDGATDDADSVRLHNIFLGILIASSR